jgi:hypothetical protein
MEQSGRNRWQPVANGTAAKAAQIGENRCRGLRVALGVAFILSLPLVAMLLTDDVVWSLADFVVAGSSWRQLVLRSTWQ